MPNLNVRPQSGARKSDLTNPFVSCLQYSLLAPHLGSYGITMEKSGSQRYISETDPTSRLHPNI